MTALDAGANVQKGKSLDSPLHAAAEKDCTDVVKLLLDFGADINARNTEFQRPVDVAPPSSLTEGFLLLYEGLQPFYVDLKFLHSCYLCTNTIKIGFFVALLSEFLVQHFLKSNKCSTSLDSPCLNFVATPRLLSQLCRHCIRNCVGRDRLHLLAHLPLPNRLRNYLQYH